MNERGDILKVSICQINSKYVHSPLASWCLYAGIKEYGNGRCEASVTEGTINEPVGDILERILENAPDIVGLSCYIWNMETVSKLGSMLKKRLPEAIIILGGPEVSYNACEVLSLYSWCDYIVSGEGEKPFAWLCNALSDHCPVSIPGVCYRENDSSIVSEPFIDSEDPPSPYCDEYFSRLGGRISYLETSRGCPYRCAFCLSGRCGGARFFDFERAKKEALLLAQSGSRTVKLVDRTFNANPRRAKEFWKFIISENGKGIPEDVCFHFEIAGDILDDESIDILSTAPVGAIQLEIGLQSFNEKTLEYINRRTDIEKLCSNIRKLTALRNMHIHIDLIAGLPYEGLESFSAGFDRAYLLYPDMLQLGFLKLLHGADMREDSERYPCVYSGVPPYEVTETEWISRDELSILSGTEDVLERMYNCGRFRRTLGYLLSNTGKGPFSLLSGFASWLRDKETDRVPLDTYTIYIFDYFRTLGNVDENGLRDAMIEDRISIVSTGRLPDPLKVITPDIKTIRHACEDEYPTLPGVKRGFALLSSGETAVFADYANKDPISGRYKLESYDFSATKKDP